MIKYLHEQARETKWHSAFACSITCLCVRVRVKEENVYEHHNEHNFY